MSSTEYFAAFVRFFSCSNEDQVSKRSEVDCQKTKGVTRKQYRKGGWIGRFSIEFCSIIMQLWSIIIYNSSAFIWGCESRSHLQSYIGLNVHQLMKTKNNKEF